MTDNNTPNTQEEISNIDDTGKIVVKEQIVLNATSKAVLDVIAKKPRELADEAAEILYEAFERDFNLTKEDGRRKYHVARKESIIQLQ